MNATLEGPITSSWRKKVQENKPRPIPAARQTLRARLDRCFFKGHSRNKRTNPNNSGVKIDINRERIIAAHA
jgi:hypothetical protein